MEKINKCKKCILGQPDLQRRGYVYIVECPCGEKTKESASADIAIQIWNDNNPVN